MREITFERRFIRRCKEFGLRQYKFKSPNKRNVSDRIVFPGCQVTAFVELKAPSKKPRKGQIIFLDDMKALGYLTFVVDSVDSLEECIDEILKAIE